MCPPGFQLIVCFFTKKRNPISPNYWKHSAKRKLETVPPRELGTVPFWGAKMGLFVRNSRKTSENFGKTPETLRAFPGILLESTAQNHPNPNSLQSISRIFFPSIRLGRLIFSELVLERASEIPEVLRVFLRTWLHLNPVTINPVIRMSRLGPFFCPRDSELLSEQFRARSLQPLF